MSPLACFPCWGPKLWRRGSHASSCSVHCGWTSRPRWRRWSRRKKTGCSDPPAPRRLNQEGKIFTFGAVEPNTRLRRRGGTYTLNAYRRAPLLACHTGGWCLCYCCTQTRCIGVDDTLQLWLLLSAPPCWQVWCLQYLGENSLRSNSSFATTPRGICCYRRDPVRVTRKDTKTSVCDFQVP